jgi:bifunctional DNA-binding transcriptional regulator/antitoxin component of YhaV-PrlF toxin-antitoxin module
LPQARIQLGKPLLHLRQHGSSNAWQFNPVAQCDSLWHVEIMTQSTITDRFQTTIPLVVREALQLKPRQRVSYELRPDGTALLRPIPQLDSLFGSVKLGRPVATPREEKEAVDAAIALDAAREGLE